MALWKVKRENKCRLCSVPMPKDTPLCSSCVYTQMVDFDLFGDPGEHDRQWEKEYNDMFAKEPWQPTYGYNLSSVVGMTRRSTGYIWQIVKKLGMHPSHEAHRVVFSKEQVGRLTAYDVKYHREASYCHIDGALFITVSRAARLTSYTKRWLNYMAQNGMRSFLMTGRRWLEVVSLEAYLEARCKPGACNRLRQDIQQLSLCFDGRVESEYPAGSLHFQSGG